MHRSCDSLRPWKAPSMTFDKIVPDIRRLIGRKLQSIRKGASITIEEINPAEDRIRIRGQTGSASRRLDELKRIWTALRKEPAVHVDSLLGGSGSSRNQPETVLANLPYVEWLRLNGRKHLVFVGEASHELGTLKEMDPIRADEVRSGLLNRAQEKKSRLFVVTQDPGGATQSLRSAIGQEPVVVDGEYRFVLSQSVLSVVMSQELSPGIYPVLEVSVDVRTLPNVTVSGRNWRVLGLPGGSALIRDES